MIQGNWGNFLNYEFSIVNSTGEELGKIDLTEKDNYGSRTYVLNNNGNSVIRQDSRGLFGNDTYNFTGAQSKNAEAYSIAFDNHGNDIYNAGLDQYIYIY